MRRRGFLGRLAAASGLAAVVKPSEPESDWLKLIHVPTMEVEM